ncbi:MAG: hypothetical protein ACRDFS_13280 [Chloroflexota bacterium]
MPLVHTVFDCKHELDVEVSVDEDVMVPASVRGLGKCPSCKGYGETFAVSGIAPKPGGQQLVLDSILMMPAEG